MTPLYMAASEGRKDIVDLLLKNKASVDKRVSETRYTPLHIASRKGHVSIINVLLEMGADALARTSK